MIADKCRSGHQLDRTAVCVRMKDRGRYRYVRRCRICLRRNERHLRQRRLAERRCYRCGRKPVHQDRIKCKPCLLRDNARQNARRALTVRLLRSRLGAL